MKRLLFFTFPTIKKQERFQEEFDVIDKERDSPIGKQIEVAYKARNGRKGFWNGVVFEILNETQYRVFFTASQEIDEIRRKLIRFC